MSTEAISPLPRRGAGGEGYGTATTVHQCAAGEMDYDPGHASDPQRRTSGYTLDVLIREEDWYDPKVLGRDAKDWLKAGGVSYYSVWRPGTWPKNRCSALVGFRMRAGRQYQVCAYVNDRDGKWRIEGITDVAVGTAVQIEYRLTEGTGTYTITVDGNTGTYAFPEMDVATYQLAVGPWHGGTSAAPVATAIVADQSYID